MEPNDLVERFQGQSASIDSIWNMFLAVHGVLIGSIYFIKRKLSYFEIVGILAGYGIFIWIHYDAIYQAYSILDAIVEDIRKQPIEKYGIFKNTLQYISKLEFISRKPLLAVSHVLGALVVFGVITGRADISDIRRLFNVQKNLSR